MSSHVFESNDYIERILTRHCYVPAPAVSIATRTIIASMEAWAGTDLNRVVQTGSVPKTTAIAGTTDVDIFISLKPSTRFTLKQIYEMLFDKATREGWSPRRQNVSIG